MTHPDLIAALVVALVAAPAATLGVVGLPALLGRPLSERATRRVVAGGFAVAFVAAAVTLGMLASRGWRAEVVHVGTWFAIGHHEATINLVADQLSMPYVCFSTGLCWLVNAFAGKYLHREPGFTRFFVLLALFGTGMNIMVLADSIDVLFVGWECLGISSALLIGFFHERRNAIDAALRAYTTYRLCDVGLLTAAVVVHRSVGSGGFEKLFTTEWPDGTCLLPPVTASIVVPGAAHASAAARTLEVTKSDVLALISNRRMADPFQEEPELNLPGGAAGIKDSRTRVGTPETEKRDRPR